MGGKVVMGGMVMSGSGRVLGFRVLGFLHLSWCAVMMKIHVWA